VGSKPPLRYGNLCQKNVKSLRPLLIFHAADFESLQYEEIRNVSYRPCIIISIASPYFRVPGAVFVEVFTVQNFTDHI
jgi:hypothetical protein